MLAWLLELIIGCKNNKGSCWLLAQCPMCAVVWPVAGTGARGGNTVEQECPLSYKHEKTRANGGSHSRDIYHIQQAFSSSPRETLDSYSSCEREAYYGLCNIWETLRTKLVKKLPERHIAAHVTLSSFTIGKSLFEAFERANLKTASTF